jgi:hypothetical protein
MQLLEGGNIPELLVIKLTVPVGLVGVEVVSVTVTVQTVPWLTATVDGEQFTRVVVCKNTTPILSAPCSVNQRLPSGPAVMKPGQQPEGSGYSVKTPLVVTFPMA